MHWKVRFEFIPVNPWPKSMFSPPSLRVPVSQALTAFRISSSKSNRVVPFVARLRSVEFKMPEPLVGYSGQAKGLSWLQPQRGVAPSSPRCVLPTISWASGLLAG